MRSPLLKYIEKDFYVYLEKPQGVPTHRPDTDKSGLVELLEDQIQQKLFIFQRLDKETSGALLFARTKEFAAQMSEELTQKKYEKLYYFVTDKNQTEDSLKIKSHIEKLGSSFASNPQLEPNSETHFTKIKSEFGFTLWQAKPLTGKPHQIRLHAELANISILGDMAHGGSSYATLCLHSHIALEHKSEMPDYFKNLELLKNPFLISLLSCAQKRMQSLTFQASDSFRAIHTDHEKLRADKYGEVLWIYWYEKTSPTQSELESFKSLAHFINCKSLFVREMLNRGENPITSPHHELIHTPETWIATENTINYEMRKNQGLSPGLFLDQRHNRQWVRENSKNKNVLNLFAYTAGFSVSAALGGATKVTTVDVSKVFIEWSKQNFKLNDLNPSDHEFWVASTDIYLKGAIKHNKKFDLIILDPPSFSRSKDHIFKIDKDLKTLIELCENLLNPNGILFVSCNYEKWTQKEFNNYVVKSFKKSKPKTLDLPLGPIDFFEYEPLMKSIAVKI